MVAARAETLLGFDYGEKRIGVAVGQTVTRTATPLETIAVKRSKRRGVATRRAGRGAASQHGRERAADLGPRHPICQSTA